MIDHSYGVQREPRSQTCQPEFGKPHRNFLDWHAKPYRGTPKSVVPDSIMPAYKHQFTNEADIETAYAEAVTVKNVFKTPYGDEIKEGEEAYKKHLKEVVLPEALKIAKEMKFDKEDVVKMVEEGKIPEIVALIAYLNRLK